MEVYFHSGAYRYYTYEASPSAYGVGTGGGMRCFNGHLLSQDRWASDTGFSTYISLFANNLRASAELALLNGFQKRQATFGESLIELGETLQGIQAAGLALARSFVAARQGNIRQALRHLNGSRLYATRWLVESGKVTRWRETRQNSLEANWLAYRYQWVPLMADIYTAVNLVNNGLNSLTSGNAYYLELRQQQDVVNLPGALQGLMDFQSSGQLSCKTGAFFSLDDESFQALRYLGLENPVEMLWAALPLSFVFDWLVPISDWLTAFTGTLGLKFGGGYTNMRLQYRETAEWAYSSTPFTILTGSGWRSSVRGGALRRWRMNSFPTPRLFVRSPFTNLNRLADYIALKM